MDFKFSNCLLEAVKAKLTDWKNVKIFYIPKELNYENNAHFLWTNKKLNPELDCFFEFCAKNNHHNHFWFKGAVSATKKSDIERVLNIGLTRNKRLRKIESKFDIKFNQHKIDTTMNLISDYDWHYVDPEYYPLPKVTDAPARINFKTKNFNYDPTVLEPKILGYIEDKDFYRSFGFKKDGTVNTKGENITWWKWEMYKNPKSFIKEWESKK